MNRTFAIALFIAALALPAAAAPAVTVMADQAKMLEVTGDPSTVVVGNPNIADVTVRGKQIFLHGRNYGTTNVIILDAEGAQLANFEVSVMMGGTSNVSIFRKSPYNRHSYVCAPLCEAVLQVGDEIDPYFKNFSDQNKTKGSLATGAGKGGE